MNKNSSRRGLSDLHRGYQAEPEKLYDPFALGERIKSLRKDKLTLTQEKFAELIGTSQATVSRWEQGLYKPQDDLMLGRVASLAGKSLVEFCFGIAKGERLVMVVKDKRRILLSVLGRDQMRCHSGAGKHPLARPRLPVYFRGFALPGRRLFGGIFARG